MKEKNSEIEDERKISKTIVDNKQKVTIKRLV